MSNTNVYMMQMDHFPKVVCRLYIYLGKIRDLCKLNTVL